MTGGEPEPVSTTADAAPRGRRRRARIALAVGAVVLVGAGVAMSVPWNSGAGTARSTSEPAARTVKVVRTDLTDRQSLDGTLGYGTPRPVKGAGEGTVTWLAPSGSTVSRGKPLYRVDDLPVPVFYGTVPLYRRLETPNTVGRDVRVIADNLRALGYDIGSQPTPGQRVTVTTPASGTEGQSSSDSAGSSGSSASGSASPSAASKSNSEANSEADPKSESATETARPGGKDPADPASTISRVQVVHSGDGVLTDSLMRAVKRWQTARGIPATGVLEAGDVAVLRGAVRVEGADVQPGDPADGTLMRVTPTTKAVTLEVDAPQVGTVKRGDAVTVRLPDDAKAAGKVAAIGTAARAAEGQDATGALKVTVTVTFTNPAKAKKFNSAPVEVDFGSETRTGVLAVPVTALLALREGGYGLRLADGRLVPVETGLYAGGMVEVSGAGIAEGARVVTAS
ncbi:peptidoglycan-binding protein [Streptomyces sp. NBC_00878]|uniref:peptidoglycan-binding protein n=1 Tax=Streptomyces sp. NBC_00878 TaxID=2975854 RepID=UPI002257D213|nr:peptidoglycan-binding protein [Streptomyces sp. NBC_00878]MCX4906998.1 peptidoglycan-binding protein [Streptomyces sp. NBC_00878]